VELPQVFEIVGAQDRPRGQSQQSGETQVGLGARQNLRGRQAKAVEEDTIAVNVWVDVSHAARW